MNCQHIEAMIKADGRIFRAVVGEQLILSNGNFMLPVDGQFQVTDTIEEKKVGELWRKHSTFAAQPAGPPGSLILIGELYMRNIGGEWIGPELYGSGHHSIFAFRSDPPVHDARHLVGVVSPFQIDDSTTDAITVPVPDEAVFARFSTQENNYYLATSQVVETKIDELEQLMESNNDKISELEEENDECLLELALLRGRRDQNPTVERTTTEAQTDAR